MITLPQYAGVHAQSPDWSAERKTNASNLLLACSRLEALARADGIKFPDNPATGSGISG